MIDPVVEPDEAPTNISSSSVSVTSGPSLVQSSVANPVVVITDTAWKVAAHASRHREPSGSRTARSDRDAAERQQHEVQPQLLIACERAKLPQHEQRCSRRKLIPATTSARR